jgi:hypothetical protein
VETNFNGYDEFGYEVVTLLLSAVVVLLLMDSVAAPARRSLVIPNQSCMLFF